MISSPQHYWNQFLARNKVNGLLVHFQRELVGIAVFSMVANLLMLTPTIYMLQVFDRFIKSKSGSTLLAVSAIALFCFVVLAFSEWIRARVLVRAGVRFDEMLNSQVFNASFSSALHKKNLNPSEAFGDLTNLRQFMTGAGIYALFDAPWVPIYLFVAYMLHPLLGLLVLIFVSMLAVVLWWSQYSHRGLDRPLMEANLRASKFVQAKLRNAEVIEAMGMAEGLREHWKKLHKHQLHLNAEAHDRTEQTQGVIKFIQYSQQSLTLAVGALLVIDDQLSAGAMVAATMLVARACQPVQIMVASWRASMAARLSYGRLVDLLEQNPENAGQPVPDNFAARLEVGGLVARAEGRAEPIISGVSAQFKAGELVAIIGPSGSGKSTFARCVLGLWEKFEGEVLLDGEAIGGWDRGQLGPYLGYVPQDVELFDGTMADNIARFGKRDARQIVEAARAASIHEMILRFPQGYDTQMGVAGSALSGGQRQRLALARALYGNPNLLVLDEPNANLDDVGEAALMAAVQRLREQGKTILFISHRGSVLGVADRIMHFEEGRLKAFGERDAVLASLRKQAAI